MRTGTGDDADLVRLHVAQALAEPAQAGERAFLARVVETALAVETRREPDHLAQAIDDRRLSVLRASDDHVEAVGPEVDSRHHVGGLAPAERFRGGRVQARGATVG